jgi:uncharacterized membrane protein
MNKKTVIYLTIILSFVVGLYSYYLMPEKMASHWNTQGQVDGYVSRNFGVFFFPCFLLFLALLLLFVPKIDPLKKNIEKFKDDYEMFVLMFTVFLFYVYVLTLLWNMGEVFNMNMVLMPAFAILFYYIGILLEKTKRNYFIGIKTPWTLASDKVWDKTHKLGGKLFKTAGFLALISIFFSQHAFFFVLIPIIVFSLYLFIFSYFEFKGENNRD